MRNKYRILIMKIQSCDYYYVTQQSPYEEAPLIRDGNSLYWNFNNIMQLVGKERCQKKYQ
jgi:hypothetical protein